MLNRALWAIKLWDLLNIFDFLWPLMQQPIDTISSIAGILDDGIYKTSLN